MTISVGDLLLYVGALAILFGTPGPVWVALIARALSGGFHAAWPLALGVVVGDVIWPLIAIFGLTWIINIYADFLYVMKYVAGIMFFGMGVMLIWHADSGVSQDSRLTKPGMWAGFVAGLAVIAGNPKAILFYMGVLPGFFDLTALTWIDISLICLFSFLVPFVGNLALAMFVDRARGLISSPATVKRMNISSGLLLIVVGVFITFS